jgi:hypothetical protein
MSDVSFAAVLYTAVRLGLQGVSPAWANCWLAVSMQTLPSATWRMNLRFMWQTDDRLCLSSSAFPPGVKVLNPRKNYESYFAARSRGSRNGFDEDSSGRLRCFDRKIAIIGVTCPMTLGKGESTICIRNYRLRTWKCVIPVVCVKTGKDM